MVPKLRDVLAVLDELYPPSTAHDWDAVGLITGDLDQEVRIIHFAVDPTLEVIREAIRGKADLVVTHHPLMLKGVHSVATTTAKGEAIHRLIKAGVALCNAHTNADDAHPGVNDALARTLGLDHLEPLVPVSPGAQTGTGRIGQLAQPMTLEMFALHVAEALPFTPQGVRVAGDPHALVQRVAVCGGSGDAFFDAVRSSRADVYVTADLRHHPALEAREQAGDRPPFLIDVAHWASEWPWLHGCASRLQTGLLDNGFEVEAVVSETRTDPWTFRLASSGGVVR